MDKLAVGPLVNPHRVSLSYPVAQNLASVADALSKPVSEVTVRKGERKREFFFSSGFSRFKRQGRQKLKKK